MLVFADDVRMPSSVCHDSPDWPNARNVMLLALAELPPISSEFLTPGAWASRAKKPTRPVGVVSSISVVSLELVPVDATSTIGEAPDTWTDSSSDPTFSMTSTFAMNPLVSRSPSRRISWKPESWYMTSNVPIGNGVSRYSPWSSVTVDISGTWSDGLFAVTVTPGRTAPLSSVTWPTIPAASWPAVALPTP